MQEHLGGVRLRVHVQQQDFVALQDEARGEIDGGRRLGRPALLIGNGEDHERRLRRTYSLAMSRKSAERAMLAAATRTVGRASGPRARRT